MPLNESSAEILTEVVSASIGGIISSSALYPLEMIKTRMQSTSSSDGKDSGGKADEDSSSSSSSGQASSEAEADDSSSKDTSNKDAPNKDTSNNSTEISSSSPPPSSLPPSPPSPPPPPSMESTALAIYEGGGFKGFWHQFHFSAAQSALEKGLYFLAYTAFKNTYKSLTAAEDVNAFTSVALGCCAEWAHLPVTLPFDVLTTQLATDTTGRSAYAILTATLSEKGAGGMYKGVQAFVVLCFKPALQYMVFDKIKAAILLSKKHRTASLTAVEAFLAGMVARTVATIAVFPYTRAKVMLQTDPTSPTTSIPTLLSSLYADEGIAGLFQGIGPELTRGVLSAALMLMVKEKIAESVKRGLRGL